MTQRQTCTLLIAVTCRTPCGLASDQRAAVYPRAANASIDQHLLHAAIAKGWQRGRCSEIAGAAMNGQARKPARTNAAVSDTGVQGSTSIPQGWFVAA